MPRNRCPAFQNRTRKAICEEPCIDKGKDCPHLHNPKLCVTLLTVNMSRITHLALEGEIWPLAGRVGPLVAPATGKCLYGAARPLGGGVLGAALPQFQGCGQGRVYFGHFVMSDGNSY